MTNPSATETGVGTGGNATASGVQFQAHVAASIAAALLAGHSLDRRLQIGGVRAKVIRLETEAPVDDILVETDNGGFLFLQAKTTTALASTLDSPLGKTVLQFVRQYLACARGQGRQGWDRPLSKDKDRLVLKQRDGLFGLTNVVVHQEADDDVSIDREHGAPVSPRRSQRPSPRS